MADTLRQALTPRGTAREMSNGPSCWSPGGQQLGSTQPIRIEPRRRRLSDEVLIFTAHVLAKASLLGALVFAWWATR